MKEKTEALLAKLQERIAAAPPDKPRLRLVRSTGVGALDQVTRESHIKMIGHLQKRYGLKVLVDQATFGIGSVDELDDDSLVQLHRDLVRAGECIADGISLEDAGLLRSSCG